MERSGLSAVGAEPTSELPIVAYPTPRPGTAEEITDRRRPPRHADPTRTTEPARHADQTRHADPTAIPSPRTATGPQAVTRPRTATGPQSEAEAEAVAAPASDPTPPASATTTVLPYIGSHASRRTRGLRAWMIAAPVDVAALLSPLLFTNDFWRGTVFATGLTVAIFALGGLYQGRRHMSFLDELPSLCGRLLACAAIVAMIAAQRHDSVTHVASYMRGVAASAALVLVGRAITRRAVVIARKRRWVEHNALVIGSGPVALDLGRLLRRYPEYGLRFAGCVDTTQAAAPPALPLLGDIGELRQVIEMAECDVIIIADHHCPEPALMEAVRGVGDARCDLWIVPRLWGSRSHGRLPDHIGAIPVVHIGGTTLSGLRWASKRAFDIVMASVALAILCPLLLVCALLTFLDGGRGILFHQERIGRDGRPFMVLKFRSMRPRNAAESATNWSIADDRRVSPIGRFLRRTSLDELPQLWNIVRGDMTFVGPRPERPYFVEKFAAEYPGYAMRHRVPAGLTGLAQVSGLRGDTPIADRARFDNYYIENWSLWLDIKVLLRTAAEVFRGGGR